MWAGPLIYKETTREHSTPFRSPAFMAQGRIYRFINLSHSFAKAKPGSQMVVLNRNVLWNEENIYIWHQTWNFISMRYMYDTNFFLGLLWKMSNIINISFIIVWAYAWLKTVLFVVVQIWVLNLLFLGETDWCIDC